MIDDVADEIDLSLGGAADTLDEASGKTARTGGKLWVTAPARNSPEIELRAMKFEDMPPVDMEFGDEVHAKKVSADPETIREQRETMQLFDWHISLARSLGDGATGEDYRALCHREGALPMPRYAGRL